MTKRSGKLPWVRTSFKQETNPGKAPGVPQDHQPKRTVTVDGDPEVAAKVQTVTKWLVRVCRTAVATNGLASGFSAAFVILGVLSAPWLFLAAFAAWMAFSFHVTAASLAKGEILAEEIKSVAVELAKLARRKK